MDDIICPHCNFKQYGENNEFYPDEKSDVLAKKILNNMNKPTTIKKTKWDGFSDEEILALGLYPDDECYKMSLITKILNK